MKRLYQNSTNNKLLLAFILLLSFIHLRSQNIVPNPGFEFFNTNSCPLNPGDINAAIPWFNPSNSNPLATPDYYNNCPNITPPPSWHAVLTPHSGTGYAGIIMKNLYHPNYREYLETYLNCNMIPGLTYTVSFWITNGTIPYHNFAINKIGVLFTNGPVTQTSFNPILVTPQIEIQTIVASTSWIQYTFTITPTTTWDHMTIGSFTSDNSSGFLWNSQNWPNTANTVYASYFIDDVAVIKPTNFSLSGSSSPMGCNSAGSAIVNSNFPNLNYSYTWLPGGQNTQSLQNLTPGNYTVQVTASMGCGPVTNTLQVTVNPPTPITLTAISTPSYFCPGIPNILSVSGASSYTWLPFNLSGSTVTVNLTSPGIVTVQATGANGCLATRTLQINQGASLNLQTIDDTLCLNSSNTINISAGSNYTNSNVSYNWAPTSQTGQTITVSPLVNTVYTVVANAQGACQSSDTLAVIVHTNCCSTPTTGLIPLSTSMSGNYTNNSYLISGNVTITNNTNFFNSNFLFMPGAKITVAQNSSLIIEHSHLYSCGIIMWDGIKIRNGASVVATNTNGLGSTLLEDAIIGIDLDTITQGFISPPLLLDNVIFNKNLIGLRFANSAPSINAIPVMIKECVFTGRNLPFTSASWPNSNTTPSGLRFALPSATLGLSSPYLLQGYSLSNTKTSPGFSYLSQPSQIGIKIENIGNQLGTRTTFPGIDIGHTFPTIFNEFNLFDGIGIGIDVENGSLSTYNNVFQNLVTYTINNTQMGGIGINCINTGLTNFRLDLSPVNSWQQSLDFGNRYWNCITGINASNVLDINLTFALFRSVQKTSLLGNQPGQNGFIASGNRFNYLISNSEFENVNNAVEISFAPSIYNIGTGNVTGIYAEKLNLIENYFGPEVSSNISLPTQIPGPPPSMNYLRSAIHISGLNSTAWQILGNSLILSNKLNRCYNGIQIDGMSNYPIEIGGNEINLYDDHVFGNTQYGIKVQNNLDGLIIQQNTLSAQYTSNSTQYNAPNLPTYMHSNLRLMHLINNSSISFSLSPIIKCNNLSSASIGFQFEGNQQQMQFETNEMTQPMQEGLSLINNSSIGMQGTPPVPAGNRWIDNAPFFWVNSCQTYVDGTSFSSNSILVCESNSPITYPVTNCGAPLNAFANGITLIPTGNANDCQNSVTYPNIPNLRQAVKIDYLQNDPSENFENLNINIFPNPNNGKFKIEISSPSKISNIKIYSSIGTCVFESIYDSESQVIDFGKNLDNGVYHLSFEVNEKKYHSKLILNK